MITPFDREKQYRDQKCAQAESLEEVVDGDVTHRYPQVDNSHAVKDCANPKSPTSEWIKPGPLAYEG